VEVVAFSTECTIPAAIVAEPSAYHCRPVRMSAAYSSVLDVVAVLVIFFEVKLVHTLHHCLGV